MGGVFTRSNSCKKLPIDRNVGNATGSSILTAMPSHESPLSINVVGPLHCNNSPRQPPIPQDKDELEKMFNRVLLCMDLPPENAKLLRTLSPLKKWDMICDQSQVQPIESASVLVDKLQPFLESGTGSGSSKRTQSGTKSPTKLLKTLEVSLRTNNIDWVREFLDDSQGLDVLVKYLDKRLLMMRRQILSFESDGIDFEIKLDDEPRSSKSLGRRTLGHVSEFDHGDHGRRANKHHRQSHNHHKKSSLGYNKYDEADDIHNGILCLRAIMNNKYGFNLVIKHEHAINCIARSLIHHKLRTKALVLELLAAICLVNGGHEIILSAFDDFKSKMNERHRFEMLIKYFKNPPVFKIEFMVACMQFINIIVHSVEDMNFRVALQHQFTRLGLTEYLEEKLKLSESDELQTQISAYHDNEIDVSMLMMEAERRIVLDGQLKIVQDELSLSHELNQELEEQKKEYDTLLLELTEKYNRLTQKSEKVENDYFTLQRTVLDKENELKQHQSQYKIRIEQLEAENERILVHTNTIALPSSSPEDHYSSPDFESSSFTPPPPPSPSLPPPPPPPPPPPAPPPPPNGLKLLTLSPHSSNNLSTIKARCKLPFVEWKPIPPRDINGTVWQLMDTSKFTQEHDWIKFEKIFQLPTVAAKNLDVKADHSATPQPHFSLLATKRQEMVGVVLRCLPSSLQVATLVRAISNIDATGVSIDTLECLDRLNFSPTEIEAYREFNAAKKSPHLLPEKERILLSLSSVERLSTKLQILLFMKTFDDDVAFIEPLVRCLTSASTALLKSEKFKKILQLILALGNYMNVFRQPSFGFYLKHITLVMEVQNYDKSKSLMRYLYDLVTEKDPNLCTFMDDLEAVKEVVSFNLESVTSRLSKMSESLKLAHVEYQRRLTVAGKDSEPVKRLDDFVNQAQQRLNILKPDVENSIAVYKECVTYFGEDPSLTNNCDFFSPVVTFMKGWTKVKIEIEKEERQKYLLRETINRKQHQNSETERVRGKNSFDMKLTTNDRVETSPSIVSRKSVNYFKRKSVEDGMMDAILSEISSKPYIASVSNNARKRKSGSTGEQK